MLLFLLFLLLPSQLGFHFWPTWSFVSGRPIDYLSPTLYLTDILILLLFVLNFKTLYLAIKLFVAIHLKFVVLVLIGIILNIVFSASPTVTIFSLLRILEYLLFGIYLFTTHKSSNSIQTPLSLAVVWSSILAWLQYLQQQSIGGLWYWLGERTLQITNPNVAKVILNGELILRPYATFSHPNALAGFLLVSFWLIKNKVIKLLIALTLLVTYSRSAILVLFFLLLIQNKNRLVKLLGLIVLLSGFYLGLSGDPFTERVSLIQSSFNLIKSSPVFGVGLGAFIPALAQNTQNLLQPVHNIYLLLITEIGLPISIFILLLIIKKFNYLLEIGYWKLAIPVVAILATGLVDHYWLTLHQTQLLLVVVLVLCLNPKNASSIS